MDINIEVKEINKHFLFKTKLQNELQKNKDFFISKICLYHFFSINEIQINEAIEANIPYYDNYFDIVYDYDFIKIGLTNDNNDNDLIEDMNLYSKKRYLLLEFKKRNFVKYNDFLFQLKTPKLFILHVIESFRYLLDSLIKLHHYNICFFDLSVDNIMFDLDYGEKPILVHFQNSLQVEMVNEEYISTIIKEADLSYTCKPLEVHVLFYLIRNDLTTISSTFIEEITEMYVTNLSVMHLFSLHFKETFKLSCISSLEKYINKPKTFIIQDIIEKNNKTWDSYSLSILYLHIFGNMARVFGIKETFIGKLSILLSKNIHPDSSKRESLDHIQENYEKLFNQVKDWSFVKKISIDRMEKLFTLLTE
jgi:hypothetical protein